MSGTDVLVVSVDSTTGWRIAAQALTDALEAAGASVVRVSTGPLRRVRTFALTDFLEARAARRVAARAIAEHDPAAVIYCSITASLLWPVPGAVWVDSLAAENRPGRHGVWQRVVERRRLARAPLILAMSAGALHPLDGVAGEVAVVPCPVDSSGPPAAVRDISAVMYAGNPHKKRLDHVLSAWSAARRGDERLVVAGLDGVQPAPGIEVAGRLSAVEYRALLRRARAFIAAPRREDYGIAPLEALADGCQLVSTPAPGAYPALEIARTIDPRLVGDDLVGAIRIALDDPVPDYARQAAELLEPFSAEAVRRTLAEQVLPRLLTG
ncbi:MAG: glycosyltransferase [Actinomycetota bacterium]|nr:glycosyltransferase [Actinomycetota bacterium]